MSSNVEYHNGKLGALVKMILSMVKEDPSLVDNFDYIKARLIHSIPELKDKTKCPNCSASMREYVFFFDAWDALLLMSMARKVKDSCYKGINFTDSNKVKIPDLGVNHSVKCRTTKASKLGLVAPVIENKKRVPGTWLITSRGWEALAGKEVPKKVQVFRNKIELRFDEMVTIDQALRSHIKFNESLRERGEKIKNDCTNDMKEYSSSEWFEFINRPGKLF